MARDPPHVVTTGNNTIDDGYGFFCDIENNDVPIQEMPIPLLMPTMDIPIPTTQMTTMTIPTMPLQIVMPMTQMPIPMPMSIPISTPVNQRKRLRPMSNLFQRTIYSGVVMYAFSVAIYVCLFMPIDF